MEDCIKDIETKLYDLMESNGIPQNVLSLGEELRQEYPEEFKAFTKTIAEKYHLSVCSAHHAHINGLLTILDKWAEEGKVRKLHVNGEMLWQKP